MTLAARRPSPYSALDSHEKRLLALERHAVGRWIYVVVSGAGDPNETPDSPTFQNGWTNSGSGFTPMRFRILGTENWTLQIEGAVTGGTSNLVFVLPVGYRPEHSVRLAGTNGATLVANWQVDPDGTVSILS